MSHMVRESQITVKSLQTLKRACQALGMEWKEGHTTARYWGGEAKGYVHAVGIPGVDWEIGVKETAPGEYTLEADFYGTTGSTVKKHYYQLLQRYGAEETKRVARLKGYKVHEVAQRGGSIRLEVTV